MFTQTPEIIIDATIGQIIVPSTATPTPSASPTPTTESSTTTASTPTPSASPTPTYTFNPIINIPKKYIQNSLSIYGFGPINSTVSLKGFGISESVLSDEKGFFRFTNIYSYTFTYPELCIQAIDEDLRVTQPSCIPALPNNSIIPLEVGPILLSPTLSISSNNLVVNSRGYLYGVTAPNSDVFIHFSKDDSIKKISLISNANAYSFPIVSTKSNDRGEFNVNLPTGDASLYRVFSSAKIADNFSAKSNTLDFNVISPSLSLFQILMAYLIQNKIMIFLFVEVVVLVFLFLIALKRSTRSQNAHNEKDYLEFITKK